MRDYAPHRAQTIAARPAGLPEDITLTGVRFAPESRVRTGLPAGGGGIRGHTFAGDVGFAGPDKGESGKYLLLPPGYQGTVPAAGYFVYRPFTNNVFVFWRAFFSDPTKLAEPVELIMTFTVMHPIDPTSPLWSATASSLVAEAVEIVVTVTGLDETMSQAVHARASYLAHEVLWGHRFAGVFTQTKDGRLAIDYRRFHDTEPVKSEA